MKALKWFEANFSGIMPLEIVVEFVTKRRRPILEVENMQKVEKLERFIDSISVVSKPVSILSLIKASKQAFYNNNPDRYALPTRTERGFILRYLRGQTDSSGLFKSFVDSTFSKMRITSQIADIGSIRMDSLVHDVIEPRVDEILATGEGDSIRTFITGTTKMFIKGNKFLI